jgi:histone deacetylase complex regulatory component SIN3
MSSQAIRSSESVKPTEMSAKRAAQHVQPAAQALRRAWLGTAVGLASAIKAGRPVKPETFQELHRLREQFEEMERARLALQGMGLPAPKKRSSAKS